jgi:hypothetical protein
LAKTDSGEMRLYSLSDLSLSQVVPRFNERFMLSLANCRSCLLMDDELNILPTSSHAKLLKPVESDGVEVREPRPAWPHRGGSRHLPDPPKGLPEPCGKRRTPQPLIAKKIPLHGALLAGGRCQCACLNAMAPTTSKGSIVFAGRPRQWEPGALKTLPNPHCISHALYPV